MNMQSKIIFSIYYSENRNVFKENGEVDDYIKSQSIENLKHSMKMFDWKMWKTNGKKMYCVSRWKSTST